MKFNPDSDSDVETINVDSFTIKSTKSEKLRGVTFDDCLG